MAKRIFSIVLIVIMCLAALASCGGKSNKPAESSDTSGEHQHSYGMWHADYQKHWQTCSECDFYANEGAHDYVDGVCTVCMSQKVDLSRFDKDGNAVENGGYVQFGHYPQTLLDAKNDADTITTLEKLASEFLLEGEKIPMGWEIADTNAENSEDIMWYIDIESGDSMYRGVYYSKGRNHITLDGSFGEALPYQNENGYRTDTVYWFKYEPIMWQVVAETEGDMTLVCKSLIDAQDFYSGYSSEDVPTDKEVHPNNYEYSTIRQWLNDSFLNTAFDEVTYSMLCDVDVDNSAASTGNANNIYACGNTKDKAFLLSVADLATYSMNTADAATKALTDYAKYQGAENSENGNGNYWLRSPIDATSSSKAAAIVDYNGNTANQAMVYSFAGVCPAVRIIKI